MKHKKNGKPDRCFMFHVSCFMKQDGFSLIELAIVLAIFLVVVGAMVNIFISMVANQKKILAELALARQTSFAMEYLSGGLRFAKPDPDGSCLGTKGGVWLLTHCGNDVNAKACSGVKFINSLGSNACTEVFLDPFRNPAKATLMLAKNGDAAQNLLSDTLQIKYVRFVIDGDKNLQAASANDAWQPKITMVFDVSTGQGQPEKILQTTVSLK